MVPGGETSRKIYEREAVMRRLKIIPAAILAISISVFAQDRVRTGDEVLLQNDLGILKGKRVGLITNQSGIMQNGTHIADALSMNHDFSLVALFGPEHGIRGKASDGTAVPDSIDPRTGVHVYSLYGKNVKPTAEMLSGIDVLVYDLQDVGVRFYTYISTLDLCMEAAAEHNIKFVVLDKPDMVRSDFIDGPVLDDSLKSFVGIQPLPSVYGMTPGELATMMNEEHLLKNGVKADLTVIKMQNYRHEMWYDQTGLKWIDPSPNLPDMQSVEVYPGCVLLEATNVSEGRGTPHPFRWIGAPFIDSEKLIGLLNARNLPGVRFDPIEFTPDSLPWAKDPKFVSRLCHGVDIVVTDRDIFRPVEMGVTLIWALHELYPGEFKVRVSGFDRLSGDASIWIMIESGKDPGSIISSWKNNLQKFETERSKYQLYN